MSGGVIRKSSRTALKESKVLLSFINLGRALKSRGPILCWCFYLSSCLPGLAGLASLINLILKYYICPVRFRQSPVCFPLFAGLPALALFHCVLCSL